MPGILNCSRNCRSSRAVPTILRPGPIPTANPDLLDQLLAEAQANTAQHAAIGLKEDVEIDDHDSDLADSQPAPNSFDVNGKPIYEPPTEGLMLEFLRRQQAAAPQQAAFKPPDPGLAVSYDELRSPSRSSGSS